MIMQVILIVTFLALSVSNVSAQSLELMPGIERVFADVQWLKAFDLEQHWTLFSRTRATVDYDNNTDLFSGAYLNYTTNIGLGTTLVGRIADSGAGADLGIHYFKSSQKWMIYALPAVQLSSALRYSWFSILRYMRVLNSRWRIYSSLELFSAFDRDRHLASVQRIRAGLDHSGYQFGFAVNLSGTGQKFIGTDTNPGVFIRKQF